jgi:hypothetical protein
MRRHPAVQSKIDARENQEFVEALAVISRQLINQHHNETAYMATYANEWQPLYDRCRIERGPEMASYIVKHANELARMSSL